MQRATICCVSVLLVLLLYGCPSMFGYHNFIPGPRIQSHYPYDVQYEATLTDGSSRTGTLPPCGTTDFFPLLHTAPHDWKRTVFLEQLAIRRGGVVQARFRGAEIEAASQRKEMTVAVIGERGLRTVNGTLCSTILNTLAEDLQVRAVYKDGSESLATWRACVPHVWNGWDIARPDRARNNLARLVVTRGGDVLHDLDARAFKGVFEARLKRWHFFRVPKGEPLWQSYRRPWLDMVLVDESGFKPLPGSHLQEGLDYQALCATAESDASRKDEIAS